MSTEHDDEDGEEPNVATLNLHMRYMRRELREHREEASKSAADQREQMNKLVAAINGDAKEKGLRTRVELLENSNSGVVRFAWMLVAAALGGVVTAWGRVTGKG